MIAATLAAAALIQHQPMFLYKREDWRAKPMALVLEAHTVTKITIHHTGVPQDAQRPFFDKLRGLQAWSQREDQLDSGKAKPQWADIPYHYYIDCHGDIAECRPIDYPGDTNTSYDVRGHALVVVEGTLSTEDFNKRQRATLLETVLWLAAKYNVPAENVKGHMDYAPGETDCPGDKVMDFLPEIRSAVAKMHQQLGTIADQRSSN